MPKRLQSRARLGRMVTERCETFERVMTFSSASPLRREAPSSMEPGFGRKDVAGDRFVSADPASLDWVIYRQHKRVGPPATVKTGLRGQFVSRYSLDPDLGQVVCERESF